MQEIVREAQRIADSDDWSMINQRFRQLKAEWKSVGRVPKGMVDQANDLWSEFSTARQRFFDRRTRFFEVQEREQKLNLERKQEIVREAQRIANSDDWSVTSQRFRQLKAEWKRVGRVPKGMIDKANNLWDEFSTARQRFFDRQARYFEGRNRERCEQLREQRDHLLGSLDQSKMEIMNLNDRIELNRERGLHRPGIQEKHSRLVAAWQRKCAHHERRCQKLAKIEEQLERCLRRLR